MTARTVTERDDDYAPTAAAAAAMTRPPLVVLEPLTAFLDAHGLGRGPLTCRTITGGNANFVGWELVGFPGVRIGVPPQLQAMSARTPPNHQSAYDFDMFAKIGPTGAAVAQRGPPKAVGVQHDH